MIFIFFYNMASTQEPESGLPNPSSLPLPQFDLNEIDASKKQVSPRNTGRMTPAQALQIIQVVRTEKRCSSDTEAMALISGLCQIGGTNRNAGSKASYQYAGKTVNGSEFSTICTRFGGTPRQFARTMAKEIQRFATKLQEPGDLSRQMIMEHPNLSLEDQIWCSNFQATNPECPELVQNWLLENYNKRFEN